MNIVGKPETRPHVWAETFMSGLTPARRLPNQPPTFEVDAGQVTEWFKQAIEAGRAAAIQDWTEYFEKCELHEVQGTRYDVERQKTYPIMAWVVADSSDKAKETFLELHNDGKSQLQVTLVVLRSNGQRPLGVA